MDNKESDKPFSDEGLEALRSLREVLQRIHNRLVSEGRTIEIDEQYRTRDDQNAS